MRRDVEPKNGGSELTVLHLTPDRTNSLALRFAVAILFSLVPSFAFAFQAGPTRLPDGTVGVLYSQQLTVVNAGDLDGPFVTTTGTLPPGLDIQITSGGFGAVRILTLVGTPTREAAPPGGTATYVFSLLRFGSFEITIRGSSGSGVPAVDSVTPSSGTGSTQLFDVTVSHGAGVEAIKQVYVIVNDQLSGAQACYFSYVRSARSFWLMNDAGSTWLGPSAIPFGSSLNNSYCSVSGGDAGIAETASQLTITVPLTFTAAFGGSKNIYVLVEDTSGQNSGWQTKGTWTVPGGAVGVPTVGSVAPSSGSGSTQTFAVTVSHAAGANAITQVYVIINDTLNGAPACYFTYVRPTNSLWLMNNSGTTWQGPSGAGSGASLSNSQCTLNAAAAGAAVTGNQLTVTVPLTFTDSFTGSKNIYVLVADNANQNSGWQTKGTWTVSRGSAPGNACSTATTVGINSSTPGRIDNGGQIDFYRIQLAQSGVLTITTTGTTDTVGILYDSTCTRIAENDDGSDRNFYIQTPNLSSGTYYISVRHYSSTGTGSYTLVISFSGGGLQRLTLTKAGTGSGSVVSSPAGINCDSTCTTASGDYSSGTQVTLTARAASGSTFTGWAGACSGTTCTVTMDGNKSVTATFSVAITPTLFVSLGGSGSGSVSSNPSGIDCGSACRASYSVGTRVTLTASPEPGSTFTGWSGACSGSTCTLTMDNDKNVTATFDVATTSGPSTRILEVFKTGPTTNTGGSLTRGTGSITSDPGGIVCGANCGAHFAPNTSILLTATADPGSTFAGWSGPCAAADEPSAGAPGRAGGPPSPSGVPGTTGGAGTAGSTPSAAPARCRVTLDSDKSITASFTRPSPGGEGGPVFGSINSAGVNVYVYSLPSTTEVVGTVTSMPAGINCTNRDTLNSPCPVTRPNRAFALGLPVILTATPASDRWVFTGWSGDPPIGGGESPAANCTNTGPCAVIASSGGKVYASFALRNPSPPAPGPRVCYVTCQATGCIVPVNFQSNFCVDCALVYNACVAAAAGCGNVRNLLIWNACR